jgi:hypothetical protein
MSAEDSPDNFYRWTIRTLYMTAIALNVWYTMETYRGTPEYARFTLAMQNRMRPIATRLHGLAFFKKHLDDTIEEAESIITEAGSTNE